MQLVSSNSNRSHVFVVLGFVLGIFVGTVLLGMPQAVPEGQLPLSLSEAFFTSTSAVCVTGLTVVSTCQDLSFWGQGVLLALFQLGGLGVMTLAVLVFESLRRRIAGQSGELLEHTLSDYVFQGNPRRTLAFVLGGTLFMETLGFCLLYPTFAQEPNPAWNALFLSVSAFCNAGFDNLQYGLAPYAENSTVAFTLSSLWLAGGFGFILPAAIHAWLRKGTKRLDASARMILWSGFALILLGPALYWLTESNGGLLSSYPTTKQAVLSFFQGNTSRTAGFSMMDLSEARRITLLTIIPLMLIGAAPGGTAGGIKTTTLWIFLAALAAHIRGQRKVVLYGRRIPQGIVRRSILICSMMTALWAGLTGLLALLDTASRFSLEALSFEAASALGTVGLSTGITSELPLGSQMALAVAMFIGRLGPLTVAWALFRSLPEDPLDYPDGAIPVG